MFHDTAVGVVKRGDGSDDDGGAVPTVYGAPEPDDPEPVRAAGPAAGARRWSYNYDVYATIHPKCHSRLNKFAGRKRSGASPTTFAWPRLPRMRRCSSY